MAKTETITCDGCGKIKGEVNCWWMIDSVHRKLSVMNWEYASSVQNNATFKHYCGQGCVIKAVSEWMQRQITA